MKKANLAQSMKKKKTVISLKMKASSKQSPVTKMPVNSGTTDNLAFAFTHGEWVTHRQPDLFIADSTHTELWCKSILAEVAKILKSVNHLYPDDRVIQF